MAISEYAPEGLAERIEYIQCVTGAIMCPTGCALLLRSLKTLSVLVERQCDNAAFLATEMQRFAAMLGIAEVIYSSLPTHPGHVIALKQMSNFGAIISLRLEGDEARIEKVLTATHLFKFAVSLGEVESLIQRPASFTHSEVPADQRSKFGIGPEVIRLAIGIENKHDLWDDLKHVLLS